MEITLLSVHIKHQMHIYITVDKEHYIIVFIPLDFVFQTLIVPELIWFFSFLLSYLQFVSVQFMRFNVICGWRMCSSLTVRPQLLLESSTWTWNLELGPWNLKLGTCTHIPVNMVTICIYNCQTRTQILIIVIYKIQSFSVFSCNPI